MFEDLVEREQAEVHGHDLDDRPHPAERGADARPHECRLRERGVADAHRSELFEEALAHCEAAAVATDVFSHQEHAVVSLQCLSQRLPHRLPIRQANTGLDDGHDDTSV